MNRSVVTAKGLGKRYLSYVTPTSRLMALLGFSVAADAYWALKGLDLDIPPGSCVGVVGDNGAGKSTLLKLLAGAIAASHGELHIRGRVTAILELGAGFHPEFTGRENLRFGGQLMGFSPDELMLLEPEIEAFSELGVALDRPLKTYSSGMVVRLAFSLVTAIQPELLIVDEALAVGDQHFQKKCINRIEQFRQNGCTILFCSHSLYHIRQLCDHAIWLHQGETKAYGNTDAVLLRYEGHLRTLERPAHRQAEQSASTEAGTVALPNEIGTVQPLTAHVEARLLSIALDHAGSVAATTAGIPTLVGPDLSITITAIGRGEEMPSMGVMLEQLAGVGVTSVATHAEGATPRCAIQRDGACHWSITLTFTELPLHSGEYTLSFYLFDAKGLVVYDEWHHHTTFVWASPSLTPGLVRLPHTWV